MPQKESGFPTMFQGRTAWLLALGNVFLKSMVELGLWGRMSPVRIECVEERFGKHPFALVEGAFLIITWASEAKSMKSQSLSWITLPKTNSSHLKIGRFNAPKRKSIFLSSHWNFQNLQKCSFQWGLLETSPTSHEGWVRFVHPCFFPSQHANLRSVPLPIPRFAPRKCPGSLFKGLFRDHGGLHNPLIAGQLFLGEETWHWWAP